MATPFRASPAPFEPGTIIADKYRVEGMIGSGGMGVVVAAHHLHLGGRVALKVLAPAGMKQEGLVKRFFQEARLASRIQSEHVVRVIDVGMLPGQLPFIVMEYLEGDDLRGVLRKRGGTLPVEDAIDYTLQAMEAVAEAHNLGIVHRDLKPQNLFFSRRADGSALVKVLDFGISKALSPGDGDPDGALTQTRGMLGSPLYVSPEQIRSAKHVDVRSDIWSLGVILYEFLTGHPPFRGDTMPAVLASVITDTPAPIGGAVRPELERVIMRCLEKSPDARFSTVGALADELVHFGGPGARLSWERIRGVLARSPMPSATNETGGSPAVSAVSGFGPTQATPLPGVDSRGGESVLELSLEPLLTFSNSHARPSAGFDPVGRPLAPPPPFGAPSPSPSSPSQSGARPPSPSSPSQSGARPSAPSMPQAYAAPTPYNQPPFHYGPPAQGAPPYGQPQGAPYNNGPSNAPSLSASQGEGASAFAASQSASQSAPHLTAGAWGSSASGATKPVRRFGTLAAALGGGVLLGTIAASIALFSGGKGAKKHPGAGPETSPSAETAVVTAATQPEPPPPPSPPAPPPPAEATGEPEANPGQPAPASSKGAREKKPREREAKPGGKAGSGPSLESLIDSRKLGT